MVHVVSVFGEHSYEVDADVNKVICVFDVDLDSPGVEGVGKVYSSGDHVPALRLIGSSPVDCVEDLEH